MAARRWPSLAGVSLALLSLPGVLLMAASGAACRSPADSPKEPPPVEEQPTAAPTTQLQGVDTSGLTPRELGKWQEYVSELLAPCADQPVSIAQCVTEARPCNACLPAASSA